MKQALKLALDALRLAERTSYSESNTVVFRHVIEVCREALKQEPVAWMNPQSTQAVCGEIATPNWTDYYTIPLYKGTP